MIKQNKTGCEFLRKSYFSKICHTKIYILSCFVWFKSFLYNLSCALGSFFRTPAVNSVSDFALSLSLSLFLLVKINSDIMTTVHMQFATCWLEHLNQVQHNGINYHVLCGTPKINSQYNGKNTKCSMEHPKSTSPQWQ